MPSGRIHRLPKLTAFEPLAKKPDVLKDPCALRVNGCGAARTSADESPPQQGVHVPSPIENAVDDDLPADNLVDRPIRLVVDLVEFGDSQGREFPRHVAALGKFGQSEAGFLEGNEQAIRFVDGVALGDVAVDILEIPLGILGQQDLERYVGPISSRGRECGRRLAGPGEPCPSRRPCGSWPAS